MKPHVVAAILMQAVKEKGFVTEEAVACAIREAVNDALERAALQLALLALDTPDAVANDALAVAADRIRNLKEPTP